MELVLCFIFQGFGENGKAFNSRVYVNGWGVFVGSCWVFGFAKGGAVYNRAVSRWLIIVFVSKDL